LDACPPREDRFREALLESAWPSSGPRGLRRLDAGPIDSDIRLLHAHRRGITALCERLRVRLLTGRDPKSPSWIDAHADGLVAILLPGLAGF